jgi:bifunctional DNA-binding transcriptional regulator/antitoxin component of YhaV-PrlF toxin-antitoxin module
MKNRARQKRSKVPAAPGLAESGQPYAGAPLMRQTVEIGAGGRLVIPAAMRAVLGMNVGDRLTVECADNELRIFTFQEGLRRMRAIVRQFVPEGVSLVDELIADRRREAAEELKDSEDG